MGLEGEDLAASLYRARAFAAGAENPVWEHLSDADQEPYLRLARDGALVIERHEGAGWQDVARAVARASAHPELAAQADALWAQADRGARLAWEAAARHLAGVVDGDDGPEDIVAQERSWGDWVRIRMDRREAVA